jgi:hypothetical protein
MNAGVDCPVTRPVNLCLTGLPEPVPRVILVHKVEVLYLSMDEMVCNARDDIRQSTVSDDSNFLDLLNMLLEELQVSKHRGKVYPTGK